VLAETVFPDRSIPQEFQPEVARQEIEAIQSFNNRRFDDSRERYQRVLEIMEDAQREVERPIHKGTPLHMIGICYTAINQHNQALRYITLAYIEDTLNVAFNHEDEADRFPAAQMLRDFYGIRMSILSTIKEIANGLKETGEWAKVFDPESVLNTLATRLTINPNALSDQLIRPPPRVEPRQPLGFPQPWEQRVFIGGNYQTHMPVIRHIESIVRSLGYTPVVAFDVEIPREHTHHRTLLLLHTCRYAIFEISSPAGQLMEIERTRDYENEVLLLYSGISPDAAPSPLVSTMIQTVGLRTEGYTNLPDIDPIIRDFLPTLTPQHN